MCDESASHTTGAKLSNSELQLPSRIVLVSGRGQEERLDSVIEQLSQPCDESSPHMSAAKLSASKLQLPSKTGLVGGNIVREGDQEKTGYNIETGETGEDIEQLPRLDEDDPYMKAWKEWVERDSSERLERNRRLERKEKLENSWNLVKACREVIKENDSDWQERKITEEEKRKFQEIDDERNRRLETVKNKKEKYKILKEFESKEEKLKRKLELADIKENVWKRRGKKSNHEECTEKLEKEAKQKEKGKVRERIKNLENAKRLAEEKEQERRKKFMMNWKEREKRKRKADDIQEGWKNIMKSIETWEALDELDMEYSEGNLEEWFQNSWTEEGFLEAGNLLEDILSEVIAFIDLKEKFVGAVPPNHQHQENLIASKPSRMPEVQPFGEPQGYQSVHKISTEVKSDIQNRLLCRTVPPNKSAQAKEIEEEILSLKNKIAALNPNTGAVPRKVCKKYEPGTVPPDIGVVKSSRRRKNKMKTDGRKGIEPVGENGIIWKSKWAMREMFKRGKLCRETVPPKASSDGKEGNDQKTYEKLKTCREEILPTPPRKEKEKGKLLSKSLKSNSRSPKPKLLSFLKPNLAKNCQKLPKKSEFFSTILQHFEEKTSFKQSTKIPESLSAQDYVQPIRGENLPPTIVDNQRRGRD